MTAERAAEIVAITADRLSVLPGVRSVVDGSTPGASQQALSLASGYPAVALLFAELGRTDPGRRTTAHEMLAHAAGQPPPPVPPSLYAGLPALAFAARASVVAEGDYRALLGPLDVHIAELCEKRAAAQRRRLSAATDGTGTTVGAMGAYDLITGMAGLGRYLLRACQDTGAGFDSPAGRALEQCLRFLAAMTAPGRAGGSPVPGWWVEGGPQQDGQDGPAFAGGHGNLGMAHGAPGPLALMAVAWQAGLRVPGQRAAMHTIVDWLLRWRRADGGGVCWPQVIHLEQARGHGEPSASCGGSWCYGVPGIARAIQLAGLALGRPDWCRVAPEAMASVLNRPERHLRLTSASVCHGWAGLLQVALRIAMDSGSDAAHQVARLAAERTIELFDAGLPFGYRFPMSARLPPDDGVGVLDGSAGTALALHSYATGEPPRSQWDAMLLLC